MTTFELSGGFSPALWTTGVEACEIPSIRQLAVAVAALSISTKNPGARSFRGMDDLDGQYALQQYGDVFKMI